MKYEITDIEMSWNGHILHRIRAMKFSDSNANHGSRLAFKNRELAEYSGKQFIDIYKDFVA